MPDKFVRPDLPYVADPLPNNDRYSVIASLNQSPGGDALDADIDYLIDKLNLVNATIADIVLGQIPGANDPANENKMLTTNGAITSFKKVGNENLDLLCIASANLQPSCVTNDKLGEGSITADKIRDGSINNNTIVDNSISFNKIFIENNIKFQEFFNTQNDSTLSFGKIIILDNTFPGEKIETNSIPAIKIVTNSITRSQLAPIIKFPIGMVIDWAGDASTLAGNCPGWLICNGQSITTAAYTALFAVIGYMYGGADTNFNLPDLRGRATFGVDTTSGQPTGNRIVGNPPLKPGSAGGAETNTLTINQMPTHDHNYTVNIPASIVSGGGGSFNVGQSQSQTSAQGGNQPHDNMSPYMLQTKLIYAGI